MDSQDLSTTLVWDPRSSDFRVPFGLLPILLFRVRVYPSRVIDGVCTWAVLGFGDFVACWPEATETSRYTLNVG